MFAARADGVCDGIDYPALVTLRRLDKAVRRVHHEAYLLLVAARHSAGDTSSASATVDEGSKRRGPLTGAAAGGATEAPQSIRDDGDTTSLVPTASSVAQLEAAARAIYRTLPPQLRQRFDVDAAFVASRSATGVFE
jgi:hypothetical protein